MEAGSPQGHNPGMAMDMKNHIGVRVKTARQSKGLTQEQLAESIGKSVETVSNIERGAMLTGIETLQRIAQTLQVPIISFFEGSDDTRQVSRGRVEAECELQALGQRLSNEDLRLAVALLETLERSRTERL